MYVYIYNYIYKCAVIYMVIHIYIPHGDTCAMAAYIHICIPHGGTCAMAAYICTYLHVLRIQMYTFCWRDEFQASRMEIGVHTYLVRQ